MRASARLVGRLGQFIFVVPEFSLVLVVTAGLYDNAALAGGIRTWTARLRARTRAASLIRSSAGTTIDTAHYPRIMRI